MAFFDGWQWDKIAAGIGQSIVPAVATYYGAKKVADANQQAAELAAANANANRGVVANNTAAITAANDKAISFLQPQIDAAAPATDYLRTVMAQNPMQLTPQQETELADRRRAAVTATPTGLRGSGRYLTASINDVNNRGKAGMITTNQARTDNAASTLAARGAGAATGAANLASNTGTQIAGQGTQLVGVNNAGTDAAGNAVTATADSNNAALQNIGSFFANAMKDADRNSRYENYKLVRA